MIARAFCQNSFRCRTRPNRTDEQHTDSYNYYRPVRTAAESIFNSVRSCEQSFVVDITVPVVFLSELLTVEFRRTGFGRACPPNVSVVRYRFGTRTAARWRPFIPPRPIFVQAGALSSSSSSSSCTRVPDRMAPVSIHFRIIIPSTVGRITYAIVRPSVNDTVGVTISIARNLVKFARRFRRRTYLGIQQDGPRTRKYSIHNAFLYFRVVTCSIRHVRIR